MNTARFKNAIRLHQATAREKTGNPDNKNKEVLFYRFPRNARGDSAVFVELMDPSLYPVIHQQDCYEIFFSLNARFTLSLAGEAAELLPGDLCIVSPVCEHYVKEWVEGSQIFSVFINTRPVGPHVFLNLISGCPTLLNFFAHHFKQKERYKYLHIPCGNNQDMMETMLKLIIDSGERRACYERLVEAQLARLLILAERDCSLSRLVEVSNDQRIPSAVYEYLNHHYSEATLQSTAAQLNYHPDYISSIMRKEGWGSFNATLNRLRLTQADVLLTSTDLTIHEVAEIVGFDSYSGFYKAFKKRFDMSPSEYLNRYR